MTDYADLKAAATYAAQDVIKFSDESEEIRALQQFHEEVDPETVLALIAENERLFKLLERTVEQYVPLTELEGVPGWSRVVELVEVVAQRDRLRAEVAGLKTGYEAYERVNADLKAENERLRTGVKGDYDLDAWLDWTQEAEALRKLAPSKEIIWCACGDGYPVNSYGAGFMDANNGVCANCDAALSQGEQS